MENSIFNKINLFVLKLLGITTPEEDEEFEKQINEKKNYRSLFSSLANPKEYKARQDILKSINTEKELQYFLNKQTKHGHKVRRIYWQAAVITLLLGCGGITCYLFQHQKVIQTSYTQQIHPGIKGAILILGDGTTQCLLDKTESITERDGSQILNDSIQLNYTQIASTEKTPIINHLIVGRGFEYMLILQDGTKVWMNSESRLDYPVQFTSGPRKVKLSGEAYFEVVHDTTRPFIVEVNQQFNVKVLGTCFNIKAYPQDDHAETTLVNGKVALDNLILKPSEQAICYKDKAPVVRPVNINYYIAWHEGWFYFNNERLEKALEQIGRWYDVQFAFKENPLQEIRVTGKIKRFENFNTILDMLSTTTGCQFDANQNTIYVTKRK